MNILVTGGTGFIGKALLPHFNHDHITVLSRNPAMAYQRLGHHIKAISSIEELSDFNDIDVVINLAGEPIVNKRWSDKQKQIICESRWAITDAIVDKINASSNPPHTFISGSAVGIYGDQKSNQFDESLQIKNKDDASSSPLDFAQTVCTKWEDTALLAQSDKTRVCLLRTGIVLAKHGGALAKMLPAYQLGLGGPLGDGQQYFPWIHLQDMVKGILFLLKTPQAQGAFNFTAPNPVTNKEFSQTLAKVLHRPHILSTPAWLLKIGLGESASLLLDGQRALPAKLESQGFHFCYPKLEQALINTLT